MLRYWLSPWDNEEIFLNHLRRGFVNAGQPYCSQFFKGLGEEEISYD